MLISAGTHTERFSQKPILALGKDTVAVTKILLTATARTHRLHAQTYQLQTIVDLYHLAGGIPIAQGVSRRYRSWIYFPGKSNWPSIELVTIGDSGSAGTRIFSFNTVTADISVSGSGGFGGNYIFSKQPNCDIELKHSVKYDDGYQSYENIKKFLPATYVYNDDPLERVRRGVIAQDVMKIDSEYVTLVPAAPKFDGEGNRVDADDTLALDSNVIMLDTVLALNYVIKQLEATQKELQELKQK